MRISKQLTPSGGWVYKQGDYTLTADSFDELYILIRSHRKSNGLEEGNITEDIENEVKRNNPSVKLGIKLK